MNMELEISDQITLSITLNGCDAVVRAGKSTTEPMKETPIANPASATAVVPGRRRGRPRKISIQESTVVSPETSQEPQPADSSSTDIAELPPEVINLPEKHIAFYQRKFEEYQEIYPEEKARDMALAMLRQIANIQ